MPPPIWLQLRRVTCPLIASQQRDNLQRCRDPAAPECQLTLWLSKEASARTPQRSRAPHLHLFTPPNIPSTCFAPKPDCSMLTGTSLLWTDKWETKGTCSFFIGHLARLCRLVCPSTSRSRLCLHAESRPNTAMWSHDVISPIAGAELGRQDHCRVPGHLACGHKWGLRVVPSVLREYFLTSSLASGPCQLRQAVPVPVSSLSSAARIPLLSDCK